MKKIQLNSQYVEPGDIFIAIPCQNIDRNIQQAIEKGASIIVLEEGSNLEPNNKFLYTKDIRLTASKLAAFCYDGTPEYCIAVTGTNGKSSVVHFLTQIWQELGLNSASLGTNGLFINGQKNSNIYVQSLTTPDCVNLHQILQSLKQKNITHFAFEASSHAIDQKRLHSVPLKVAAFTNLATDHLDYHKTKQEYFTTKQKLFTEIKPKIAVFPKDNQEVFNVLKKLHNNFITFGLEQTSDICAFNIKKFANTVEFNLNYFGQLFPQISLNIFGSFQVLNVLCSIAISTALNLKIENIINSLVNIKQLDGRMEYVGSFNGGNIYVDYAHTAEGFEKSLQAFRKACQGKLITVFGCGGDRDKTKRSIMGKTAEIISDINIITDDNPRTENPADIRKQIIEHCSNAIEIPSRKKAIQHGISLLTSKDMLVVIGKGNEQIQIYKNKTLHHNDRECILKLI